MAGSRALVNMEGLGFEERGASSDGNAAGEEAAREIRGVMVKPSGHVGRCRTPCNWWQHPLRVLLKQKRHGQRRRSVPLDQSIKLDRAGAFEYPYDEDQDDRADGGGDKRTEDAATQ